MAARGHLRCRIPDVPGNCATPPSSPPDHPRLLGSRAELQALAKQRPAEYQRVVNVARQSGTDDHAAIISQSLVATIEGNGDLGRQAKQRALRLVDGPIRAGHVPFGNDLALSALAYDLCFEWWTEAERERFHTYFNRTVDANVQSEAHVFHNASFSSAATASPPTNISMRVIL